MKLETCRKWRSIESSPTYPGEMAEWSKAVDSKSIVRSRVPGVRIPLSPPDISFFLFKINYLKNWFLHLGWCLRGKNGHFNGHFVFGKVLVLTYRNYLIRDTLTSSYLFRILIPKDLRDYFGGRTSFKVSLRNGIKNECLIFSKLLYLEVQSIFKEIRMGKESNITLKQIQEILRDKIERTILQSE